LTKRLLELGYYVRGIDKLFFGGESLLSVYNHKRFEFFEGDLRNSEDIYISVKNIDTVIHLAGIVGDPACAKKPDLAEEINWTGSKNLFDICRLTPSVKKFVFASTCSNYGKMNLTGYVDENSPLKPLSLYATLKVRFEKYMMESKGRNSFNSTILRFATAYGLSPRMRFDLTVNEFIKEVALGRLLTIYGEEFWRPYCHVNDIANAVAMAIKADPRIINNNIFGVGDTRENYQKRMIAQEILKIDPRAKIEYVQKKEDPRDYRVSFKKIRKELDFRISKFVHDGISEIYSALKNGIFKDPDSNHYHNNKVSYEI
jgi:nucleoside-diphosphate-sugar epimerase